MDPVRAATVRSLGSLAAGALSAATLVAAVAVYAVPAVTPVGTAVALALSATTLSLPVLAGALAWSLYAAPPGASRRAVRALRAAALATLCLFVAGLLAVVRGTGAVRTLGDGLYALAIVLLLVLSVTLRLAERSDGG